MKYIITIRFLNNCLITDHAPICSSSVRFTFGNLEMKRRKIRRMVIIQKNQYIDNHDISGEINFDIPLMIKSESTDTDSRFKTKYL
jgi:hypothetical protein